METVPPPEIIDRFVAAAHGDLNTVKKLLDEYPGITNLPASWGELAIQAAAQTGQREIAEMLLGAGAPMDICCAAMLGKVEQVARYLEAEPSLAHATGAHDLPVLYHATVTGQVAAAEILVERGADVNAGQGRNTPLHGAVYFGQIHMVAWLLAHGANMNALDHKGNTPLTVAQKQGKEAIADLLEVNGAVAQ